MLYDYINRIYEYAPFKIKWWHIRKRLKLFLLIRSIKKDLREYFSTISYDDFVDLIPEFCSVLQDMNKNASYTTVDTHIKSTIIEYPASISYLLITRGIDSEYGGFTLSFSFNTKEPSRLHFRISLSNNMVSKFNNYDGYIEKKMKFIVSKNIKDAVISYTKDLIYKSLCDIMHMMSNRYIYYKEGSKYYDDQEFRNDS